MPRTAATRSSNQAFRRSRSSAGNSAQVPLLFRLPQLDTGFATADAPEQSTPVDRSEAAEPAKTQSLTPPPVAQAVHPERPEAAIGPAIQAAQPATSPETDRYNERSWWEHWSSGIVLILLVIAIVVASIIALGDAGSTDPSLLARDDSRSEFAASADDYEIPSIEVPELAHPATTPSMNDTTAAQPQPTEAAAGPLLLEQSQPESSLAAPAENVGGASVELAAETIPQEESLIDLPLEAPIESQFTAEPTPTATPEQQQFATADLLRPVAEQPVPLFTGKPELFDQSAPANSAAVAAQPVSAAAPTVESEQYSSQSNGESPSLYDGAQNESVASTPAVGATTLGTTEQPQVAGSASTNAGSNPTSEEALPSIPALLTSNAQSPAQESQSTQQGPPTAQMSPLLAGDPAVTQMQPDVSAGGSASVTNTATPEFNADEVIRRYQQFRQMQEQQTQSPANRYAPPAATTNNR